MTLYPRRRSKPFGMDGHPFNPETGEFFGFDGPRHQQRARIVSEDDDTLQVRFYDRNGELLPAETTVSKLIGLRKQDYDGEEYDDATYAYVDASTRTATDEDDNEFTHRIMPSYRVGLDVLVERPVGGTGVTGVEWIDVTPGRWWLEDA